MEPLKPGYKTTEFWVLLASKVLSLLALLGVIAPTDVSTLNDAAAKLFSALGVILVQGVLIWHYISQRSNLKQLAAPVSVEVVHEQRTSPPGNGPRLAGLLVAATLLVPGLAPAQEHSRFTPAPPATKTQAKQPTKTCLQVGLINIGGRRKQPDAQPPAPAPAPAPQTDPAVLAELKRIGDLQAQQVALLQAQLARQSAPAPAPAPGSDKPPAQAQPPHIIIISPGTGGTPKVELPPGGTPKFELPPGGTPRYVLPPGGDPKYVLPPGGAPRVPLPEGGTPRAPLPEGGTPKVPLSPGAPALPELPSGGAPPVGLPSGASAGPPPAGFMRYTKYPLRTRYALYR